MKNRLEVESSNGIYINVMNTVLKLISVCLLEWNILVPANFKYRFGNHIGITAKIYIYILLLLLCKIMNLI